MKVRALYILALLVLFLYKLQRASREVTGRGILEHDEGHALLNANTWHHIMRWVLTGGPFFSDSNSIASLRDTLHQQGGTLYSAGKFGYSLLLALAALPVEVSQSQALLMAWICGFLVCVLVGLLTMQISKMPEAGFIAAVGCYLSPLLGELSREVSGTIWALFFGLAAANVLIFSASTIISDRRRWILGLLSGALLGYGFTCHFNLAPFVVAVFLAAGLYASQMEETLRQRATAAFKFLIPAAIGSLSVLAAFEVVTQAVDFVLRDTFPEYLSFFGEHRRLFFRDQVPMLEGVLYGDGAVGWGREAWMVYYNVARQEGLFVPLLVLAIPVALFLSRLKMISVASAAVMVFVPLLFWLAYVYRVERVMGMVVATGWMFIAISLCFVLRAANSDVMTSVAAFGVLILILMQVYLLSPVYKHRKTIQSPLPEAVTASLNHIAENGGTITAGSFDTGFAPLWKWTIIEALRLQKYEELQTNVDFSRFTGADIIFIDPSTWRRPSGEEFTVTRQEALLAETIYSHHFTHPPYWNIQVKDLRAPANDEITSGISPSNALSLN